MPASLLIRLRPTSPWRIGPDSGARDRVGRHYHSDALFAAVCAAMARLDFERANLADWLDATARATEPAVRFSSLFPFQRKTMYATPPRHLWPPQSSSRVRWSGARFVPLNIVEGLLEGSLPEESHWRVDAESQCLIPQGGVGPDTQEAAGPYRVSLRASAAVDREGQAVAPHAVACLEFSRGSGLWCVAEFADDAARARWRAPLMAAFRLLADSGFGGERSRGWGRAEAPEFRDGDLARLLFPRTTPRVESPEAYWLLSLYHPSDADPVDWSRGNYSLTTRGGRVESDSAAASGRWGTPKKLTRLAEEGSVLVASSKPTGSAPDVSPENVPHPVYRAGFALAIGVPLKVAMKLPETPTPAPKVELTGGAPDAVPVGGIPEGAVPPTAEMESATEPTVTETPLADLGATAEAPEETSVPDAGLTDSVPTDVAPADVDLAEPAVSPAEPEQLSLLDLSGSRPEPNEPENPSQSGETAGPETAEPEEPSA